MATSFLFSSYVNIEDAVKPEQSFVPFLRTIIARPDLASHCRSIELREFSTKTLVDSDDKECWKWNPWCDLSKKDFDVLLKAAQGAGTVHSKGTFDNYIGWRFTALLAFGIEDVQIILMLACLPNIEQVTLHGFPACDFKSLDWKVYLERIEHHLLKLTHFSAGAYDGRGDIYSPQFLSWDMEEFTFLFRLPCMRTFRGETIYQCNSIPHWDFQPASLTLTTLKLLNCQVSSQPFSAIIEACKELEHFEYSWGEVWSSGEERVEEIYVEDVLEALSTQKDSLRTLPLDFCDYGAFDLIEKCVGSLKAFSRLSQTHVEYVRLTGRNLDTAEHDLSVRLPKAIELLSLAYADDTECRDEICRNLISLAQNATRTCLNLRTVAIRNFELCEGPERTHVKSVFETCELELRKPHWGGRLGPISRRKEELLEQRKEMLPAAEFVEYTEGLWEDGWRSWGSGITSRCQPWQYVKQPGCLEQHLFPIACNGIESMASSKTQQVYSKTADNLHSSPYSCPPA